MNPESKGKTKIRSLDLLSSNNISDLNNQLTCGLNVYVLLRYFLHYNKLKINN